MAELRREGLAKEHPGGVVALRELDLQVRDGELVVLVGPSGCGKTTALRLVAGLEAPSRGRVRIDGRDVTTLPPRERDVAMVFQSYALYPHKSVRENLGFGLRMRGTPRPEIARRVEEVARTLGLAALLERRPAQLSGGQRQRVALGRAIVREPKAFLLDEPLSNLDARLRAEMRAELARLHRRLGATMLYVTHDQEEALTLGDRVVVLRDGAVQQAGPPLELYARPANVFVAGFLGAPAMNLLPGASGLALDLPSTRPPEPVIGVRPGDVALVAPGTGHADARVEVVEVLGHATLVHLRLAGSGAALRALVTGAGSLAPAIGETAGVRLATERLHLFDPRDGLRLELSGPTGG